MNMRDHRSKTCYCWRENIVSLNWLIWIDIWIENHHWNMYHSNSENCVCLSWITFVQYVDKSQQPLILYCSYLHSRAHLHPFHVPSYKKICLTDDLVWHISKNSPTHWKKKWEDIIKIAWTRGIYNQSMDRKHPVC